MWRLAIKQTAATVEVTADVVLLLRLRRSNAVWVRYYSFTQRTEYPLLRLLLFAGMTLPLLKFKLYALLLGLGETDKRYNLSRHYYLMRLYMCVQSCIRVGSVEVWV